MFSKINWNLLWESTKEPLRLLVLGIVAFLITHISGLPQTEYTVIILMILRFVDKLLYEFGKETGNTSVQKGLTRF